ncbi:MAG: hypothetical protein KAJ19_10910 [Gammaproteobacteria bacterium]|nr:hypothetical protein [Gammaproteobacteria bacterium]
MSVALDLLDMEAFGPVVDRVDDPDIEPPDRTFTWDHDFVPMTVPEDVPGTAMALRSPVVVDLVVQELLNDPVRPGVVIRQAHGEGPP